MVQDRKEPTLNSIAPDRDEILTHQNRMGSKRPPNQRRGASRPPSSGSSPMGAFALIVAIVATAGAGVAGWQLFETQKALSDATVRIENMETQLNLNNNQSSQSVTKLFERLDNADAEVRKLWGVAYDTNRKAIATNKDSITAVSGRVNDATSAAKEAKDAIGSIRAQSNEQQLVVNRVLEDVKIQEQQMKQLTDLANRVEALSKKLETRVGESEEAIEAINAFRRTTNNDIQQLKQQLGNSGPG
jgi:methyl-accepting chemotaxis protein